MEFQEINLPSGINLDRTGRDKSQDKGGGGWHCWVYYEINIYLTVTTDHSIDQGLLTCSRLTGFLVWLLSCVGGGGGVGRLHMTIIISYHLPSSGNITTHYMVSVNLSNVALPLYCQLTTVHLRWGKGFPSYNFIGILYYVPFLLNLSASLIFPPINSFSYICYVWKNS